MNYSENSIVYESLHLFLNVYSCIYNRVHCIYNRQLQRAELLFQGVAQWTVLHLSYVFLLFIIYNDRKHYNLQEFILISGGYRKLVFRIEDKKN